MRIKDHIKTALLCAALLGGSACSPSPESLNRDLADLWEDAAEVLNDCDEHGEISDTVEELRALTEKARALRCKFKGNAFKLGYKVNSSITEDESDELSERITIARYKFDDGAAHAKKLNSEYLNKAIEEFEEELR